MNSSGVSGMAQRTCQHAARRTSISRRQPCMLDTAYRMPSPLPASVSLAVMGASSTLPIVNTRARRTGGVGASQPPVTVGVSTMVADVLPMCHGGAMSTYANLPPQRWTPQGSGSPASRMSVVEWVPTHSRVTGRRTAAAAPGGRQPKCCTKCYLQLPPATTRVRQLWLHFQAWSPADALHTARARSQSITPVATSVVAVSRQASHASTTHTTHDLYVPRTHGTRAQQRVAGPHGQKRAGNTAPPHSRPRFELERTNRPTHSPKVTKMCTCTHL